MVEQNNEYSIWILEYAHALEFPIGGAIAGRHNAGTIVFPYCYGVVQSAEHTILIDCGYDNAALGKAMADNCGVTDWQPPEVVLAKIGIAPEDVDTLLLTHLHFDHAGNAEAFPNAHIYIQQEEITKFLWAESLPRRLRWLTTSFDPDDVFTLLHRCVEGSLTLVDGNETVLPGIELVAAHNTHTLGSQFISIDDGNGGRWVMSGDNVYVWENLEGVNGNNEFIPVGFVNGSHVDVLMAMDDMYRIVDGKTSRVLPFHENLVWDRYPSKEYADRLHVAEITLRSGDTSRIGNDQ